VCPYSSLLSAGMQLSLDAHKPGRIPRLIFFGFAPAGARVPNLDFGFQRRLQWVFIYF
jgi:hypothetical protein